MIDCIICGQPIAAEEVTVVAVDGERVGVCDRIDCLILAFDAADQYQLDQYDDPFA